MCAAAIEQARVPIPFLQQRSRSRTTKTIPCVATNVLNADAGAFG